LKNYTRNYWEGSRD